MYLAIDIGNTRTKIGVYNHRNLFHFEYCKTLSVTKLEKVIKKFNVAGIGLCASGLLNENVTNFLSNRSDVIILRHDIKLPITISYKTPATLGKDRIAAAIGAFRIAEEGQGALIINMGTCITMDFIDSEGVYRGGNISPGMTMRIKAMHKFTAKLPLVEKAMNAEILGFDTTSALQNGAVAGANREIDTFISQIQEKYQPISIIVSGGDADYFVKYTKKTIFARPFIVLEGLIETLIYNGI